MTTHERRSAALLPMGQLGELADVPKTMARIRRLVREHPNDREMQRMLHALLTSISSDGVDEAGVSRILTQVGCHERRVHVAWSQHMPSHSSPCSTSSFCPD